MPRAANQKMARSTPKRAHRRTLLPHRFHRPESAPSTHPLKPTRSVRSADPRRLPSASSACMGSQVPRRSNRRLVRSSHLEPHTRAPPPRPHPRPRSRHRSKRRALFSASVIPRAHKSSLRDLRREVHRHGSKRTPERHFHPPESEEVAMLRQARHQWRRSCPAVPRPLRLPACHHQ